IRSRIAAVSTVTGAATSWNPSVGVTTPQVRTLALAGKSVYLGGQFTQVGGEFRNRAAGLTVASNLANDWDPNIHGLVRVIVRTIDALYVGGDFTSVGGQTQTYFAAFPAVTMFLPGTFHQQPNGDLSGSLVSADGNWVTVQASSDFVTWSDVGVPHEPLGFPIPFTDPDAKNFTKRFYRA